MQTFQELEVNHSQRIKNTYKEFENLGVYTCLVVDYKTPNEKNSTKFGKRPIYKTSTYTNSKDLTFHQQTNPLLNLGVCAGKTHFPDKYLITLDFDNDFEEAIQTTPLKNLIQSTKTTTSGRGLHVYFFVPFLPMQPQISFKGRAIGDTRGNNGMTVAPGSIHQSWTIYTTNNNSIVTLTLEQIQKINGIFDKPIFVPFVAKNQVFDFKEPEVIPTNNQDYFEWIRENVVPNEYQYYFGGTYTNPNKPSKIEDRSKFDYSIALKMVNLGFSLEDYELLYSRSHSSSKFKEKGFDYLETTWNRAFQVYYHTRTEYKKLIDAAFPEVHKLFTGRTKETLTSLIRFIMFQTKKTDKDGVLIPRRTFEKSLGMGPNTTMKGVKALVSLGYLKTEKDLDNPKVPTKFYLTNLLFETLQQTFLQTDTNPTHYIVEGMVSHCQKVFDALLLYRVSTDSRNRNCMNKNIDPLIELLNQNIGQILTLKDLSGSLGIDQRTLKAKIRKISLVSKVIETKVSTKGRPLQAYIFTETLSEETLQTIAVKTFNSNHKVRRNKRIQEEREQHIKYTAIGEQQRQERANQLHPEGLIYLTQELEKDNQPVLLTKTG